MSAQLRSSKSTIGSQIITMQSVMSHVEPPLILNKSERTHFDRIVKSREIATWSEHDLALACALAQAQQNLVIIQKTLKKEGLTTTDDLGKKKPHVLLHASFAVSNKILLISKVLGLGASQRGMASASQKGRNISEQAARKVIERVSAEDLI